MHLNSQDKTELLALSRSATMRKDSDLLRATTLQSLRAASDPGLALLEFLTNYSDFMDQAVTKKQFIEKEMRL